MKDMMSYKKSEESSVATLSSNTLVTNTAPSFSDGFGRVTTSISDSHDIGRTLSVQTDGKILLGGYSYMNSGLEFSLVRYNINGSLDTTFDGDGKLTTNFGWNYSYAESLMLQTDGKILLAGVVSTDCGNEFALVRYNNDGSLDTTFSDDGKVITNVIINSVGKSIAVQTDGKILLGGSTNNGSVTEFALVRYNNNGSLDTTFDGDGKLTTNFGVNSATGKTVTVQTDGKILLGGNIHNGCGNEFALARYNNNGSLDTTFDGDGKLTTNFGASSADPNSVTVQTDGKILLGGNIYNGCGNEFALARYNNNGSLDTTFDGDGRLTTNFGTNTAMAGSVTVQIDGKILLGGYIVDYSNFQCEADFALVRYNSNGSLDTTFDGDGKLTTDFGDTYDNAMSVKVQADGKILLGGATQNYCGYDFALVRYESDGSLDTTFGEGNSTLDGSPTWDGEDPVVLDDNAIISDAELSAADNFAGSTLTLERQGGANANDVFSAIGLQGFNSEGLLSLDNGKVFVGETEIGTYTQSGGRLKINFNANATQELVNQTVQQIAYFNNSPVANGTANISWTFNDGSGASNAWVRGNTEVELSPDYSYGVVIDGKANVGQTLTAYNNIQSLDNVEPFGVDAPVLSYQWQANGINIRGATSSTYKLTTADFGKKIKVVVTEVGNNIPLQKFTSAETVAVGNINKVGTGTVTIAGTPTQGETLTASSLLADLDNGVTPNNVSADVVFYQWKANGVIIAESSAASNDASLTLTQAQVGKRISVDAIYVDNLGNREVVSSRTTAVVANVNDAPTGGINFNHHNDVPYVGQTLSFTNDIVDLDGLPTTIRYQWTADGVAIRGAISTSYVVRESDLGKKIQVVATYTDLFGTAERVVSIETDKVTNEVDIAPVSPPPMAMNGANALLLADQILSASEAPQALVFDNANYHSYGETEMIGIKPWEFNIV